MVSEWKTWRKTQADIIKWNVIMRKVCYLGSTFQVFGHTIRMWLGQRVRKVPKETLGKHDRKAFWIAAETTTFRCDIHVNVIEQLSRLLCGLWRKKCAEHKVMLGGYFHLHIGGGEIFLSGNQEGCCDCVRLINEPNFKPYNKIY